jgi:hypothetical protein
MLKRDKLLLITLLSFFLSCSDSQNKRIKLVSINTVSLETQLEIYKKANDSLKRWCFSELDNFRFATKEKEFIIDSVLCFNKEGTRFVSVLINRNISNPNSDGFDYFYGEKMNDKWYFFRGAYTVIPREMVPGHDIHKPLSYQQLHEIALKEVYANYLLPNGEINENWFKQHFEGDGYGKYRDKAHLDSIKIASCKMLWVNEKKIFEKGEIQVTTDPKKKINIIRFPLKQIDKEGYLYPIGVTLQRFTAGVTYQYIDKKEHYWNYIRDYTPVSLSQINSIIEIQDSISYKGDKEKRDNCYRVTIMLGLDKGYLTSDSVWARAATKIVP